MAAQVSVLLPVFNAQRYLRGALESLQAQTWRDFEVIAIDDGSTDGSLRVLQEYARRDGRFRVISRSNTGIVGALNDGLLECRGEFVARMDADDICLPERFAAQMDFLSRHSDCVALGADVLFTDPEGDPLIRHRPALEHEQIVEQLMAGNGGALIHPSIMMRKSALDRTGLYRERYQWIEDLDLYLRLAEVGRLANLPEVLLHYRQHLRSISRTHVNQDALRREMVNAFRQNHGLGPMSATTEASEMPRSAADWRRYWAYDASRGGNWRTAARNARRALLRAPWDLQNWRCWRYVRGRVRQS